MSHSIAFAGETRSNAVRQIVAQTEPAALRTYTPSQAVFAKSAGVFWKQEREFLRQARSWSLDDLDKLQPEVLAADRACKTAGSPDHLIAERLALTIAGRAKRLGL